MLAEAHLGQFGADSVLDFHLLPMTGGLEGQSNIAWSLVLVNMTETFEENRLAANIFLENVVAWGGRIQ